MFTFPADRVLKPFWLLCLLCLWAGPAQPASVWKVSKQDNSFYLGGTLHLLTEQDYPLESAFDKAYQQADTLIFETDQGVLQTPEFQRQLMQHFELSEGEKLSDALAPQTYADLQQVLRRRGMAGDAMQGFKASMAALTLTMTEFRRLGYTQPGVDSYFYERAVQEGKATGQLETPQQQLTFLTSMGGENPDQLIRYTIKDIDEMPEIIEPLHQAWRKGDTQTLNKLGLLPMQQDYLQVYKTLIKKRNQQWMKQLLVLAKHKKTYFVLVGALHLVGEDGLLQQLQRRGFKIEQL